MGCWEAWIEGPCTPKVHINVMMPHPGSKAQHKGESSNHVLQDPDVYVVSWARVLCVALYLCQVFFRQINEVTWSAEYVQHVLLQSRTMVYGLCFTGWSRPQVVQGPISPNGSYIWDRGPETRRMLLCLPSGGFPKMAGQSTLKALNLYSKKRVVAVTRTPRTKLQIIKKVLKRAMIQSTTMLLLLMVRCELTCGLTDALQGS